MICFCWIYKLFSLNFSNFLSVMISFVFSAA